MPHDRLQASIVIFGMTATGVDALLDHIGPRAIVLADKAYDADRIRELIQDRALRRTSRPSATVAGNPASASGSTVSAT